MNTAAVAVIRTSIGFPELVVAILALGLLTLVAVLIGKNRPQAVGWIAGGFALLLLGGVLLPVMARLHGGPVRLSAGVLFLVPVITSLVLGSFFFRGRRGVRVVIAAAAAVAVAAIVAISWHFPRNVYNANHGVRPPDVRPFDGEGVFVTMVEPAIWQAGVMDDFAADVYPSKRAAVLELARRAADEGSIRRLLADERVSREIWLLADNHEAGLLNELAGEIGRRMGIEGVTCSVVQNTGDGEWPAAEDGSLSQLLVQIRIRYEDMTTNRMAWGEEVSSGKAVMQVKGPKSLSATTVAFVEKPWVENFSHFLSERPAGQFLLAKSNSSCTTASEAGQQAMQQACEAVGAIVRHRQAGAVINPAIEGRDLESGGVIVDRFSQRFAGMTGPIWREAVLVDVSDAKMQALAERKIAAARQERTTWAKMGVTLAGMFALICVVYVFLNAATRGYYTWALRIAVVALTGAGAFFLLLLA